MNKKSVMVKSEKFDFRPFIFILQLKMTFPPPYPAVNAECILACQSASYDVSRKFSRIKVNMLSGRQYCLLFEELDFHFDVTSYRS